MINAIDFEYDGHYLSELGMMICSFNYGGGIETSEGATITFQTVKNSRHPKEYKISSGYGDALTCAVQICKIPEVARKDLNLESPQYFTGQEYANICGWLQRTDGFHRLTFIGLERDSSPIHYEATATRIDKFKMRGNVIGLEIQFRTNCAFGFGDEIKQTIHASADYVAARRKSIVKFDDDIRTDVYPDLEIETRRAGYFKMQNLRNETEFAIAECSAGERFTYDGNLGILISSTRGNVTDDMNFFRFRLTRNFFDDEDNEILIQTPSIVTFSYMPLRADITI